VLPSLLILSRTSILETAPSVRQLNEYLVAYNAGGAKLREFMRTRFEWPKDAPSLWERIAADQLRQRTTSGGFELGAIRRVAPASVVADVKSRRLGTWSRLSIFLVAEPPNYDTPVSPYRIAGMGMGDEPAPEGLLPKTRLSDAEIARRMSDLMTKLTSDDAFSGTVLIARNGKPIFARAYGLANSSYNVPNSLATRFNLASITKMFTAVAIAQLEERGKLSFGDTVGKLLPDYPNEAIAKGVTIHQLLSHTSGMIGGRELAEKAPTPISARTVDDHMRPFVKEPLAFTPGERFGYSNAGFILLGKIVEKVSGLSYYQYVRNNILLPAGMADSGFPELDVPTPNLASGYEDGPSGQRRDNVFDLTVRGSPAGGAYATAVDMDRFARALTAGRLVRPATLACMWKGVTSDPDAGTSYGYGATVERYAGSRVVSHGGGWKGITNHFEFLPNLGVSIVVLGNTDSSPNVIAFKAREWIVQGSPRTER
jgi:CubicO group peptidase (beta-lactamase class C family)